MSLHIAQLILLAACLVGGGGAIRIIRSRMSTDVVRASTPLFYVAAALALAAVTVLAVGN